MATIRNTKSDTLLSGTSDKDSIRNYGSSVTINCGKGDDYVNNWSDGENTSINGGAGNDSISNSGSSVSINGGDGNDYINNFQGDSVTIDGGAGDDEIHNSGDSVTIYGSGGNDYIFNTGKSFTIDAGDGNDTIYNSYSSPGVTLNGGTGNDSIYNGGSSASIDAGAGNDTIFNNGSNVTIDAGKGNDEINIHGSNNLIKYSSGDGNDIIEGFRADSTLQIGGGKGTYSTQTSGNDLIVNVGKGSILLKGVYSTLDKININNKAIELDRIAVSLTADDNDEIYVGRDSISVVGSASNDSIYNYGNSVTIVGGKGNDYIDNSGDSVTLDGGEGKDVIINSSNGTNVTINGGAGNDEISNSGDSVTIDGGDGNDFIGNAWGTSVTIDGGKGNDTIYNGGYIDGGSFYRYDDYGSKFVFKYTSGDGNDKIYGFRADSTLQISDGTDTYSTKKSGDNVIVTVGKGKISLMGAASLDAINIETENDSTLLSLDNNSKSSVTIGAEIVTADASARTKAINIVGNSLDNSILGGSGKDKLYGKDGNDTLWGGKGNDTLSGGNGEDLFVYTAGNDVITDYTEDSDKISISAVISKSSVKGSDATFTIGKNTLTVKDGFGKEIVFIDADGKERTIIGGAYLADDSSSAKSTLSAWREVGDASERTKAIRLTGNELDNSILGGSGKDSLYGDDGNDYLFGGAGADKLYGQNGNDTLWGGIGNDTLKGGDGADVFIYRSGEGKDVISDFGNDDMLLITGAFSASYDATKNSLAFKVGSTSNAITLKNFTATKFNINGINYKISGSKLVMK